MQIALRWLFLGMLAMVGLYILSLWLRLWAYRSTQRGLVLPVSSEESGNDWGGLVFAAMVLALVALMVTQAFR